MKSGALGNVVLGVVMLLSAEPLLGRSAYASKLVAVDDAGLLRITVCVRNYAHVRPLELERAIQIATRILERTRISPELIDCSSDEVTLRSVEARISSHDTTLLFVTILPPGMAKRFKMPDCTLGIAGSDDPQGRSVEAWVFYEMVEMLAEIKKVSRDAVLGHAIAHEICHLLLGTRGHSISGLMQPGWDDDDLQRAGQMNLGIPAKLAARIRANVQARNRESRTTHAVVNLAQSR